MNPILGDLLAFCGGFVIKYDESYKNATKAPKKVTKEGATLSLQALMELKNIVNTHLLFPILAECQVIKSEANLSLLQHVIKLRLFAHANVMRNTKPEMYKYQSESLLHYCHSNYACCLVDNTPICVFCPNAAILHYDHASEPNAKLLRKEDICLFDLGAK